MVMLTCRLCNSSIDGHRNLMIHRFIEHNIEPSSFPCPHSDCNSEFSQALEFYDHILKRHSKPESDPVLHGVSILQCIICKQCLPPKDNLYEHLVQHISENQAVICPVLGCSTVVTTHDSFRDHLRSAHKEGLMKCPLKVEYLSPAEIGNTLIAVKDPLVKAAETKELLNVVNNNLEDLVLKYKEQFNLDNFALAVVFDDFAELAKLSRLFENQENLQKSLLEEILSNDNLLLSKTVPFVEPKTVTVVHGLDCDRMFVMQNSNQTYETEIVYISILESIKALFTHPTVVADFLTPQKSDHDNLLTSFWDGQHYSKNSTEPNEEEILINLFVREGDRTRLGCPSGPNHKIRLCGVYFSILNILPHHRSASHTVLPCILMDKSLSDRQTLRKVIEPLAEELKVLTQGIYIPELRRTVKGRVAYISGSNRMSNAFAGFITDLERGEPQYRQPCRFCKIIESDFKKDKPQYYYYGLQYTCHASCFEPLQKLGLDSSCSFPPDFLDDLLEGCLRHELSLVLIDLMGVDILTNAVIYDRANSYRFKGIDAAHKPVLQADFDRSRYEFLPDGNALANLTFLRMFSILFEEFLPQQGNLAYDMLMFLKEIVEICLAPVISKEMVQRLAVIVKKHRQCRIRHFDKVDFDVAVHNLEHYAIHLLDFGPRSDAASLHFEEKHASLQQVLDKNENEPDPVMIVALDHAKSVQEHLSDPNLFKTKQVAEFKYVKVAEENKDVRVKIRSLTEDTTVKAYSCFVHNGVTILKNESCVLVKHTHSLFLVGKVKSIVEINSEPYVIFAALMAELHKNRGFYTLHSMRNFDIVKLSDLASQVALPIYYSEKGDPIITLLHAVPITE